MQPNSALITKAPELLQAEKINMPNSALLLIGTTSARFREATEQSLNINAPIIEVKRFRDGETSIKVPANVRDKDVYLVHSMEPPVNNSLMELCLTLDALKKASANRVTVILPYMGYARQDRRMEGREPISAQLVARFIEISGADRAIILDLHSEQVQGFFRLPVDNIYGTNLLMPRVLTRFRELGIKPEETVIVSPDAGGAKRARAVAKSLGARFALIDKMRARANEVESMVLLGDVSGSTCLIVDDMVDTAGTLTKGAELLREKGAKQIFAACTHALLSGDAQEKIENSAIEEFFVSDSIKIPEIKTKKLTIVELGNFISELVRREVYGESMQNFRSHLARTHH